MDKQNILEFDFERLATHFKEWGEPAYRSAQVLSWIHQKGVIDFHEMTNLSKTLRQRLDEAFYFELPEVALEKPSSDGTIKWLLKLACGNQVETVYIPESDRATICVSSQVGCGLNCSFCATGKQGYNRDLSLAEMLSQFWLIRWRLLPNVPEKSRMTNVVFMGMGEPLLNYDHVSRSVNILLDDRTYGLSKYRVTVSTSGLIPQMRQLSQDTKAALAVSLHAPNDTLRNELVPINKKYPLKELMAMCRNYFKNEPRRKVTMEYVMLNGVNDSVECARQLVKLLKGVPCKVNLIPFNPFPGSEYRRSSDRQIQTFRKIVSAAGIQTTVRKTRGEDVDAACGQLVGEVSDRTKRSARWKKKLSIPVAVERTEVGVAC